MIFILTGAALLASLLVLRPGHSAPRRRVGLVVALAFLLAVAALLLIERMEAD